MSDLKNALQELKESIVGYGFQCHKETYELAIKTMEKADKYRWHDLRKNPEDLPNDDVRIEFQTIDHYDGKDKEDGNIYTGYRQGMSFYNDDAEGYVTFGVYKIENVIAWREIEPYDFSREVLGDG